MSTRKIQVTLSDKHLKALEKYARKRKLLRGGQPNINAALRETSAAGLGDDSLTEDVQIGPPTKDS